MIKGTVALRCVNRFFSCHRSVFALQCGALILFFLLVAVSSCSRREQTGTNPGDFAPGFRLQTLQGDWKQLSDYRGKRVLLNFWATWCAPCVEEMPDLERLYSSLDPDSAVVIAIAVDDDPQTLSSFQKRLGLSFPILLDTDGSVRDAFRVEGYPETFLLDREGKIRMIVDPIDSDAKSRLTGPRPWHQAPFRELLLGPEGS